MKTTNIYIIVLTLLLSVSVQAQTTSTSGGNEAYKGIENTLLDFKDDVIETVSDVKDKAGDVLDDIKDGLDKISFRDKFMQRDIRLIMTAEYDKKDNSLGDNLFYLEDYNEIDDYVEGDIYKFDKQKHTLQVNFDWDNKALVMEKQTYFWDQELQEELGGIYGPVPPRYKRITNRELNSTQYIDKDGNWYSPVRNMEGFEEKRFIKFNAKQMAISGLEELLDLSLNDKVEKIEKWLFEVILNTSIDINAIGMELFGSSEIDYATSLLNLLKNFDENNKELQEEIRELIKKILNKKYTEIVGYPIFIHWAFKYSPEVIQAHYGNKVDKATFDCDGFANACSKFTVLQGPDKGKSMSFDRLGRLTFINSLKDGTAKFFYDKDITVTLPDPNEVLTLSSMMGKIKDEQDKQEEQTKKEQEEAKKRATEELAKRKKKELISKIELKIYKEEADIADLEKELRKPRPKSESDNIKKQIKDKKTKVKQYKGMIENLKWGM